MKTILTKEKAKNQAKLLETYLGGINRKVSHGNALEAVAAMYGSRSWNVLSAQLESAGTDIPAPAPGPLKCLVSIGGKLENLYINAEVHSDDHVYEVDFNALPWLIQASNDEILALAEIDWGGDSEADEVAIFIDDRKLDAEVCSLFAYLDMLRTNKSMFGEEIGFEVSVDSKFAMQYCRAFRYPLFVKLMLIKQFGSLADALSAGEIAVFEDPALSGRWRYRTGRVMPDWLPDPRDSLEDESSGVSDASFATSDQAYAALGMELETEFQEWTIGEEVLSVAPNSGILAGQEPIDSGKVLGRLAETGNSGAVLVLMPEQGHLSRAALRHITQDCQFYLQVAVPVALSDLIDEDIEHLNDLVSEAITGSSGDLSDLSFKRYTPANETDLIDTSECVFILVTAGWSPMDDDFDDESDSDKSAE